MLTSDGTITHGADASTDLVIGRWTHIVGVYDGAAITLYVDGLEVASTPYAGSIYDPPGVGIEINAIQRSGEVLHSMVGQIDEMKVYDVASTPRASPRCMRPRPQAAPAREHRPPGRDGSERRTGA